MSPRAHHVAAALLALVLLCSASRTRAQITAVTDFAPNPAGIEMFVHEPASVPAGPRPLVVALHGCVQTAGEYARTGWNQLADEHGFYVVYPQQSTRRNAGRCFNWGGGWDGMPNTFVASSTPLMLGDIRRGGPELVSIVAMVDHVAAMHDVDLDRVYVTGLSGGGGMASVVLAAYPDRFAGGAIIAGIPYGCATDHADVGEANACTRAPTGTAAYLDRTPAGWAALAREGYPGYSGPMPRVSVWHFAGDFTVAPAWSDQIVEQWTAVHGADTTADATETLDGSTRTTFTDPGGRAVVERWVVPGTGHGTPVDPARGCGMAGSYILDAGICSSRWAAEFLGLTSTAPVTPRPDAGPPVPRDAGPPLDAAATPGVDGGPPAIPTDGGGATPMTPDASGGSTCGTTPPDDDDTRGRYQLLGCQAGSGDPPHHGVALVSIAAAWALRVRRRRA